MKRYLTLALALCLASPLYAGTRPLKEDTAVTIVVGPFVDSAGVAVTAPTIANIDITAYKNDGTAVTITPAASGTANDMVHVDDGYYSLELTATDTATPGYLRTSFQISGALIFHEDWEVLPANIYDSRYGSDKLQVDTVQVEEVDASLMVRGYKTVTALLTSGDPETIIEAVTEGEVLIAEGTHTENNEIAVASGVTLTGNRATLLTGDPGSGTNALLRVNGANHIRGFKADITGTAQGNGHVIGTTNAGNACNLLVEDMYLGGSDDTISLASTSSGRHNLRLVRDVIDMQAWDGVVISANADVQGIDTDFIGVGKGVYCTLNNNTVNALLDSCRFRRPSDGQIETEAIDLITTHANDRLKLRLRNTDFEELDASGDYITATVAASTGQIIVQDLGGNNLEPDLMTFTAGSGTASFTRVDPYYTFQQAASLFSTAGTLGKELNDKLEPTTVGRTLDVSAGGEAGLDWANVGSPTTANVLSGTTVGTATAVTNGVSVGTGGITAPSFGAGAIDATAIATDAFGALELAAGFAAEIADAVWDELLSGHTTEGSAGETLDDAGAAAMTPVAADVVGDARTWIGERYRARNIVEVGDNFDGTLALRPDMNPGVTILTVDSVSITGAATVTATTLTVNRSRTKAHCTVPTLATTGTYTVVWTVTTIDGDTIPTTCTLIVR